MSLQEQIEELRKEHGMSGIVELLKEMNFPEDSGVRRHAGRHIMVPEHMSLPELEKIVVRLKEDLEKGTRSSFEVREAKYDDMLVALDRAIKQMFGGGTQQGRMTFFGEYPPSMRTVRIGVGETISVPEGKIVLPGLYEEEHGIGWIDAGVTSERTSHGRVSIPVIQCYVRKKHMGVIHDLVKLTRKYIREDSIYRGKIITSDAEFTDLSHFDADELVLSRTVRQMFEAYILEPIRNPQIVDELKMERTRAGLLVGEYGTGKTMSMKALMIWANQHGWTAIGAKPGSSIVDVVELARKYQPALITMEDIDEQVSGERDERMNQILNTMSGVLNTEDRVFVVMTTNNPDRIHQAMLRPGRIHFAIKLGALDGPGLKKMSEMTGLDFAEDIDWDGLAEEYSELTPAYDKEALSRVGLVRSAEDRDGPVTEENLRLTLEDMREHKRLQDRGMDGREASLSIDQIMEGIIEQVTEQVVDDRLTEYFESCEFGDLMYHLLKDAF